MKNKEIFNLIGTILVVIAVVLLIFSGPGLKKDGVIHKEFIDFNTLGIDLWISKKHLSILFASLFFFTIYCIKVIVQKFSNTMVNSIFIIASIALLFVLDYIRKLGYINLLTGETTVYTNNLFSTWKTWGKDTFFSRGNLIFMGLQLLLLILVFVTATLTVKRQLKLKSK